MSSKKRHISVTQLASFACRTGDLVTESVAGPTAREGMRAHSQLQKLRLSEAGQSEHLHAEWRISCQRIVQGKVIQLGGRIDLIDTYRHQLSEIKTSYVPGDRVPSGKQALQWAQLYLYGFVYLQQRLEQSAADGDAGVEHQPLATLDLELVHVNLRDNSQHSQMRKLTAAELHAHGAAALDAYVLWLDYMEGWQAKMRATASTLDFPFRQFRAGQREMAIAVYRSCRDASMLMCEAATGIGKTLSSLYPAIKSMGEGDVRQIVFLTAKVAGRRSVEQAVKHLTDTGLQITMLQLAARASSCFCHTGDCELNESGQCPMTLGFYDRLPDARKQLLDLGVISNVHLKQIAWQHQLCPAALVQQLLPWVHIVVADYNYVFDPLARLPHFNSETSRTVLLVDEAHNLLDRARMMYSARLDRDACRLAASDCRKTHPLIARALDRVDRQLSIVGRRAGEAVSSSQDNLQIEDESPAALARAISEALQQINVAVADSQLSPDEMHTLWLALCRYCVIHDLFTDRHRFVVETKKSSQRTQVTVSLFCTDPSQALAKTYSAFKSLILFSATLRPADFYRESLGVSKAAGTLQLPCPFDTQNRLTGVVDWVDTRYRYREASLSKLVELIHAITQAQPGNYLVFFPSFAYLDLACDLYRACYPDCKSWSQSRLQSKDEQQSQIDELEHSNHSVGFAIQGGVFGEGVDYKGDWLIGSLIIGTGLPAMNWQSDLVSSFYAARGQDGYKFAYEYPGFTRVLQSAGRVIRSEHDKGVVILIDPRFKKPEYRNLFPAHWSMSFPADETVLHLELRAFWSSDGSGIV